MLKHALAIAVISLSGAGLASASSVSKLSLSEDGLPSVLTYSTAPAKAAVTETVAAPVVAPGGVKIEIREVDGEKMIFRTENLIGGSPITMVRKATEADIAALEGPSVPSSALGAPSLASVNPAKALMGLFRSRGEAVTEAPEGAAPASETATNEADFPQVVVAPDPEKLTDEVQPVSEEKTGDIAAAPADFDAGSLSLRTN